MKLDRYKAVIFKPYLRNQLLHILLLRYLLLCHVLGLAAKLLRHYLLADSLLCVRLGYERLLCVLLRASWLRYELLSDKLLWDQLRRNSLLRLELGWKWLLSEKETRNGSFRGAIKLDWISFALGTGYLVQELSLWNYEELLAWKIGYVFGSFLGNFDAFQFLRFDSVSKGHLVGAWKDYDATLKQTTVFRNEYILTFWKSTFGTNTFGSGTASHDGVGRTASCSRLRARSATTGTKWEVTDWSWEVTEWWEVASPVTTLWKLELSRPPVEPSAVGWLFSGSIIAAWVS